MRDELVGLVEDALGRKVIAFVSGNPSIPTSPPLSSSSHAFAVARGHADP